MILPNKMYIVGSCSLTSNTVIEDRCTSIAIREVCNIRDGIEHLPFATNYKAVIESTCIN